MFGQAWYLEKWKMYGIVMGYLYSEISWNIQGDIYVIWDDLVELPSGNTYEETMEHQHFEWGN